MPTRRSRFGSSSAGASCSDDVARRALGHNSVDSNSMICISLWNNIIGIIFGNMNLEAERQGHARPPAASAAPAARRARARHAAGAAAGLRDVCRAVRRGRRDVPETRAQRVRGRRSSDRRRENTPISY